MCMILQFVINLRIRKSQNLCMIQDFKVYKKGMISVFFGIQKCIKQELKVIQKGMAIECIRYKL